MDEQTIQILKELGAGIKDKMWSKHMRVGELSKQSGVSKAVLYKIFKGESYTMRSLLPVLKVLEIEILHIKF